MLLIVHVLAGSTIALVSGDLALSAPVCFTTHFLFDAIPHWNFPIPRKRTLQSFYAAFGPDLVATLVVFALLIGLFPQQWYLVAWGAGWAVLPDWLTLYRTRKHWRGLLKPFYAFHNRVQWEVPLGAGIATQAIVVFILVVGLISRLKG